MLHFEYYPFFLADNPEHNSILKYGDQFSLYLAKGLSDNWSQVGFVVCIEWEFFVALQLCMLGMKRV